MEDERHDDFLAFACAKCDGQDLRVEHYYSVRTTYRMEIPCSSDNDHEYAQMVIYMVTQHLCQYGPLGDDLRVEYWDGPDEEDSDEENLEEETNCEDCRENAAYAQHLIEIEEMEVEELDNEEEWQVKCDKCGQKIEFEWSHPGGGGRILPRS